MWAAVAVGSLAGLAILGACSDSPNSKVAGLKISEPRFAEIGLNAHNVVVCLDPLSTAGSYSFSVAQALGAPYNYPMFEPIGAIDPPGTAPAGVTQTTSGPWAGDRIVGNTSLAAASVTLTSTGVAGPPDCENVFVRATTTNNLGNRLWTYNPGTQQEQVVNRAGTVIITPPSGATYTAVCVNDDPNLAQTAGCTGGPIAATTTFSSANVFHGSVVTYRATRTATACPAGSFTFARTGGSTGDLVITYDQFPAPNDNSYGENSVGWKPNRPHTFKDLVNSDHAGIQIRNMSGQIILSFDVDYLTKTSVTGATPSGYASLGVLGGDGRMRTGTSTGITATTSLAKNLNTTGYCVAGNCTVAGVNLLQDSPPTTPGTYNLTNAAAHGLWDFRNTYFVTIAASKIAGFGSGWVASNATVQPNLDALHNSPDKACPEI